MTLTCTNISPESTEELQQRWRTGL